MRGERSLLHPETVVYDSITSFIAGVAIVGPVTPTTADS